MRMEFVRGLPVPDTQYAILPSAGVPRCTPHDYVATVEIEPLAEGCRSFEFIYACKETGRTRRWGYCDLAIDGRPLHAGHNGRRVH
jgi:hypothetical protein